jgi:CheY-like chemotaxis protein
MEARRMPDSKLLSHAAELRARAEEISAKADTFKDADSQQKMRAVAALYGELAQRIEHEVGRVSKLPAMTCQLAGKRILIVEDEPMIAEILASEMAAVGAEVVGPAPTDRAALHAIAIGRLDGATVDVKLMGQMCFSVADALAASNIPFLFVTGYGQHIPFRHANVRQLQKPIAPSAVCLALEGAMSGAP